MAYDFSEQLRQIRGLTNYQPAEQRGGTEIVNAAIEQTLPQVQQNPTIPEGTDPYTLQKQREILAAKAMYEGAQQDAQRLQASKLAEAIRAQAKAGGVDLSGFGSGVSLEQATGNLASQEARDIVAGLRGKYSMTADQFFSDNYRKLLQAGYSPRQAKKFAGYNARDYQANRVAYLDNLYNSYGRDGLVTTPLGNQIIGQLATENPMLANFYANAYPGAKDAYRRENEVADLMTSHGFDMEKLLAAFKYNSQLAAQQGQIARKNYAANSAVDEGRQIRAEGRAEQQRIRAENRALDAFRQKVANTLQIAGEYLPPEAVEQVKLNLFGLAQGGDRNSNGGVAADKLVQQLTGVYNALTTKRKALAEQDLRGGNAEIQKQIQALDAQAADIYDTIQGLIGIAGEAPKFTGDWNRDKAIVDTLREEGKRRGLSWQQTKEAIYKQILADTGNEEYAKGAAGLN